MTNHDCGLRRLTNAAAILPPAPAGMQPIGALIALLFLTYAGFAQQTPTLSSDAQSSSTVSAAAEDEAPAQKKSGRPKWGIFAGYASIETNNHNFHFNPDITAFGLDYDEHGRGFEIGGVRNLNRYFGIVGLFDAYFSSNHIANLVPNCAHPPCAVETLDINPSLFRFTAGPEVAFRNHTRITPFADVLFGLAHSHALFHLSEAAGKFTSREGENGFAINFAAGLEVRVVREFSFRGSIDYGKALVGSSALPSQLVDSIGFSTGLLVRFH